MHCTWEKWLNIFCVNVLSTGKTNDLSWVHFFEMNFEYDGCLWKRSETQQGLRTISFEVVFPICILPESLKLFQNKLMQFFTIFPFIHITKSNFLNVFNLISYFDYQNILLIQIYKKKKFIFLSHVDALPNVKWIKKLATLPAMRGRNVAVSQKIEPRTSVYLNASIII